MPLNASLPPRALSLEASRDDWDRPLTATAALMLVVAAATVLAALAFEHIGGYQPCALCLMQRTPYYLGIPVALAALAAVAFRAPRAVMLLFAAFAALMIYNAGLAAYHSGVEWKYWEGPASCAPAAGISGMSDMLDQLENARAPSCTEAVWRFLGLSFAGWNVIVSALLAAAALRGFALAARRRSAQGSSSASQ